MKKEIMNNKIALFSDVHSNPNALQAVLNDIRSKGIEKIYCLGDLVGYCVFPNEVVEIIKNNNIPTIMGNHDETAAYSDDLYGHKYIPDKLKSPGDQAVDWTMYNLKKENKDYLKTLQRERVITLGNYKILLVHGSPGDNNEYLFENRSDVFLETLFKDREANVIICGHTHIPYHRILKNNYHVINDGSTGKPHDGDPRASYVILGENDDMLEVNIVRVAYDFESMAKAIEESPVPSAIADIIRAGKK